MGTTDYEGYDTEGRKLNKVGRISFGKMKRLGC
jgi:hypothetical protein